MLRLSVSDLRSHLGFQVLVFVKTGIVTIFDNFGRGQIRMSMSILIWLLSIDCVIDLVHLIAHPSLRVVIELIDAHLRALHLI